MVHGERYFSKAWAKGNISFGALYPNEVLAAEVLKKADAFGRDQNKVRQLISKKVELNPSIHFWTSLLLNAKVIKKSLIRDNPAKFRDPPKSLEDVKTSYSLFLERD